MKLNNQVTLREVEVGFSTAMGALIQRSLINTYRDPVLFKAKLFQAIFMALIIGGVYFEMGTKDYTQRTVWQSISGFLFFTTINALMTTLAPITLTFPLERDVFFKEQDSKMYNVVQYFFARNIVQLPQYFIIPMIFCIVDYFMIYLAQTGGQFFIHYLVFALMSFCGSALGLLIGSVILDPKSVSSAVPILLLPIYLFSGFLKNRNELPGWIGWLQYISPNKYGLIAFVENQVAYKESNVEQLAFDLTKWESIIVLFCLGVGYRILALFFLWVLKKKSQ